MEPPGFPRSFVDRYGWPGPLFSPEPGAGFCGAEVIRRYSSFYIIALQQNQCVFSIMYRCKSSWSFLFTLSFHCAMLFFFLVLGVPRPSPPKTMTYLTMMFAICEVANVQPKQWDHNYSDNRSKRPMKPRYPSNCFRDQQLLVAWRWTFPRWKVCPLRKSGFRATNQLFYLCCYSFECIRYQNCCFQL